jgi:hypothetical protein
MTVVAFSNEPPHFNVLYLASKTNVYEGELAWGGELSANDQQFTAALGDGRRCSDGGNRKGNQ